MEVFRGGFVNLTDEPRLKTRLPVGPLPADLICCID
jgi:hypothetical protein